MIGNTWDTVVHLLYQCCFVTWTIFWVFLFQILKAKELNTNALDFPSPSSLVKQENLEMCGKSISTDLWIVSFIKIIGNIQQYMSS